MGYKYHSKLLKLFNKNELDLLMKNGIHSIDKEEFVNVIVVMTDKIDAEILTDCEAKYKDKALIINANQNDSEYFMSKEKFWNLFKSSNPEPYETIIIDE
jgi:S-methylmethionine-dependent homocysteine/selenocysteine methylase